MLRLSVVLAVLLAFVCVASASETGEKIVSAAKASCAEQKGEFKVAKNAVTKFDLTGDNKPDEIVDAAKFTCSTAASLYGGSGGTELTVIVDGSPTQFLAHNWKVVTFDKTKVLLLAVHHSVCGEEVAPCFAAYTWNGKGFWSSIHEK